MRCYCCNNILTPKEGSRRFKHSGTFTEMCNTCLSTIDSSVETVDSEYVEDDEKEDEDKDE